MEDILDNLTEAQNIALKQFRKNLEDLLTPDHTDHVLVKFLRAKNFNLKESEKIFRANFHNRITFGVNTILGTYKKPLPAKLYETIGILGYAKNGTLIRYASCGRLDLYGFIMSMSCCDLCLYFSHIMEYDIQLLKEENKRSGKNIQEITYIFDIEGFSIQQVLHKCVIEMGSDLVSLVQDCYPEIWSKLLVINVPGIFDKAFNLFKPFLRAHTLERMEVADKSSSKDLLLKYIDENVLPAFLGGKRVDSNGDPMCREFITFGGKVPEELYSEKQRIPLRPTDPGVKSVYVRPRSMHNQIIAVREPGLKVRFQLRSENGSIPITIFFKEFDPDSNNEELPAEDEYLDENTENFKYKQVCVVIRQQAHCTQEDSIMETFPGIYIIRLSNAGNWFTPRKLLFKYEILNPNPECVS